MDKVYEFTGPFSTLSTKKKLERLPNREIKELLDSEIDVYTIFYKEYGLTEADVKSDLDNGVMIAVFRDSAGRYLYIPDRYVKLDVNAMNDVDYTGVGITIDLGAIPSTENVDSVLEDIKTYIEGVLGISPHVAMVKTSSTSINKDDHDAYEAGRKLMRTDRDNYYLKLLKCQEEKTALITYLEEIDECAINEHCDCDSD